MEKGNQEQTKKRISLRWGLVFLIVGCWILPIILLLSVSGFLSTRSTRQRVSDIVTASVESTFDNVRRGLDSAVNTAISVSYVPTVRQAYMQFQADENTVDLIDRTRTFLFQQYSRSQEVSAAYLVFPEIPNPEHNLCYTFNPTHYQSVQALEFYTSGAAQHTVELMAELGTDVRFFCWEDKLYLVRNLSLRDNRFDPYAILVNEVNLNNLFDGLHNLQWLTGATVYIDDERLDVFANEEGQEHDFSGVGESPRQLELPNGEEVVQAVVPGQRYTLRYSARVDLQPLRREMGDSFAVILIIVLLSVPLLGLVLVFFWKQVNEPIKSLRLLAGRIEKGELGAQTETEELRNSEFYYLGTQMNRMSAQLQTQFERLYREELALRDAQIKALQSQINPHFLGNTLEIINWEARLAGDVKASKMLEALSTILHATLDRDHRPLVHLSEEMMYINAYLFIIHERLGKRLEICQEIDESLLDWYVPRLILQPIVENAVEHGVSPRQRGRITIRAVRQDNEWMRLEVENDTPMSDNDVENVRRLLSGKEGVTKSSANIGIRNVHQRLRILYGPQSGLSIKNDKNGSTVSSMCIQNKAEAQEKTT